MIKAIWSRTAQTRSCRCRSCFHAATTVARRATTAASRRRLKVSDFFTACYSTILATAAVADARVKDDRRKEWDRVIAEAKAELGHTSQGDVGVDRGLDGDIKKSSEAESTRGELKTYSPWTDDGSQQTCGNAVVNREAGEDTQTSGEIDISKKGLIAYSPWRDVGQGRSAISTKFEIKLKALDHKIRMSSRYDLKDDVETEHASDMEWIDEEPDLILYERDPLAPIHLERRELSCATLIEQLLTRLVGSIEQRTQKSPNQKAHPELQDMVVRIQHLRQRNDKLPSYKWEDLEVISRERRALHRSLVGICNAAASDDVPSLELMVAKICYNLLIFQSPISMVTYNVLVQSLDHLKQYDLAQVFVDSFFYDTRLKPNHNSISIILEHYHQKNDSEGWRAIKDRMRASKVGCDMRIKRRWFGEISRLSIQDWIRATNPNDLKFQKGRCFQDKAKYVSQKAPRDCNAFDALIRSALSFTGPRNAIVHIKRALLDYQDIYSETTCEVMEELLRQRDGRGSTSLINSILTLWEEGSDPDAITFTGSVRRLIYQLLDMMGVDTTLGSQLAPPYQLSLTAVHALLRQMHMVSIYEALGRSSAFIDTIEAHLEDLLNKNSRVAEVDRYINTLELELSQSQRKFEEFRSPKISQTDMEGTDWCSSPKTVKAEIVPHKELPPLGWFAEVEAARVNDLVWNKASGRWARLECLENQLSFHMQRLQGLQDRALPILLKAMPRYQQLRYFDINSSSMVYRGKCDRPRQYEELLRVRAEGAMGFLNFVQRQLEFRQLELSKIEAEVFSITPINRLSLEDLDHYLVRAAAHILTNEQKGAALQLKSANLMQESQSLQMKANKGHPVNNPRRTIAIGRLDDIAKQLWKLETDFTAINAHQTKLLHMKETLNMEGRRRLLVKLQQMVKRSGILLCKYEDGLFQLTRSHMPCTFQRANWLVKESDLKVRGLAHDVRAELHSIREQRGAYEQQERRFLEKSSQKIKRVKASQRKLKQKNEIIDHSGVPGDGVTNSKTARLEARKASEENKKITAKVPRAIAGLSLHDEQGPTVSIDLGA